MSFKKPLPTWKAQGIQPPEHKLEEGWKAQDKPPAGWLNWQANTTYEALQELQENAVDHRDVTSEPSANGVVRLNEAGNLNEAVLAGAEHKEITLKPGVQIVESDQDTPFNVGSIKGRTLVNRMGREGSFGYNSPKWLIYRATGKVNDTVYTMTADGTVTNPQIYNYQIGSVPSVGDKLYIRMTARSESDKCASLRVCLYHKTLGIMEAGAKYIPKVGKWYDVGGVLTVTQEMVDLWSETSVRLYARYDKESDALNAVTKFCKAAIYTIPVSDASLSPVELVTKYPFVDSMTNVVNPYVIATGDNLLPPFTEWTTIHAKAFIVSPYTLRLDATATTEYSAITIPAKPGETYTLSYETNDITRGWVNFAWLDAEGVRTWVQATNPIIATAPPNTVSMQIRATNIEAGTFTFKNPMLSVGAEVKPFKPQRRSVWAAECQLAANPIDGTSADELFTEDDGQLYVLEKWANVELNGSLLWKNFVKKNGFTVVRVDNFTHNFTHIGNEYGIKFDGALLVNQDTGSFELPDRININASGHLFLSIANTDSGWGEAYEPTPDEIKAYFMGWRMSVAGQPRATIYDGKGTKVWIRITRMYDNIPLSGGVDYTSSLPAEQAGSDSLGNVYTPYHLQYLKATPTVEPVRNYEQGLTLYAGFNVTEVGSGIVIRENANPSYIANYGWYIADKTRPESYLAHAPEYILYMYRNQKVDLSWEKLANSNSQGYEKIKVPEDRKTQFDSTAVYHVTYTMLDPTLSAPINGNIATNLRGTVSDLVQRSGDVERRLSVVENQKAEKDNTVVWITPALLNGWTLSSNGVFPARYCKDGVGNVHVNGIVTGGATETVVFRLPAGYRPKTTIRTPTTIMSGTNVFIAYLDIKASGDVIAVFPTQSTHLSLQMSFLAEQ